MFKTKRNILLTLILCALLLPMTMGAKHQVTKPLTIRCTGTTDLNTGKAFMVGVATHSGAITNEGQIIHFDPQSGVGKAVGTLVSANGDKVDWDATFTSTSLEAERNWTELTVTVTGGTGRFEDASGGFDAEYVETVDWIAGITTYSFTGTGTITY